VSRRNARCKGGAPIFAAQTRNRFTVTADYAFPRINEVGGASIMFSGA
jgi:hypothetical protein